MPKYGGGSGPGFNSSKVRLEDQAQKTLVNFHAVSIPLRCDWKPSTKKTIKSDPRFNSSKVRLEVQQPDFIILKYSVSIPLRCDWKLQSVLISIIDNVFQFL